MFHDWTYSEFWMMLGYPILRNLMNLHIEVVSKSMDTASGSSTFSCKKYFAELITHLNKPTIHLQSINIYIYIYVSLYHQYIINYMCYIIMFCYYNNLHNMYLYIIYHNLHSKMLANNISPSACYVNIPESNPLGLSRTLLLRQLLLKDLRCHQTWLAGKSPN